MVASAQRPTLATGDVMDAVDGCRAELAAVDARAADAEVLACSSAGGGLRVAVVGHEALVTAEAGRRVALSSGGKVVGVIAAAGRPVEAVSRLLAALVAPQPPDLVLLTGGTDGGNRAALVDAARAVAGVGVRRARSWWPATSTPGTRSQRSSPASRTCSPTTPYPGSGCSRPRARGRRCARSSCST